jgi:hypothetical protein
MITPTAYPFVGREDHLERIRQKLVQPRTANRLNIFGGDGLGKSQLLLEIVNRLNQDNQPNKQHEESNTTWRMLYPPEIILIRGEGFGDTDNFIDYLHVHLKQHLVALDTWQDDVQLMPHELVAINLRKFNRTYARSVIFLIDDFHRILSRMTLTDVSRLNEIYPQNTHYILVTNHHSIHQLAPNLENSSEFLVADTIELMALPKQDSLRLVEEVNKQGKTKLTREYLEIAQRLAGGHPALLIATVENLQIILARNTLKIDNRYLKAALNQLPLEPNVNIYLNKIKNAVISLRVPMQEFLVHIATGQLDKIQIINQTKRVDAETARDLARMGIISPEYRILPYRLDSIYMQYIVTNFLHPVQKLSDQEQLIFDLFMNLDRFVRFEDIERKFEDEQWFTPNQNRKSVIESAVSRLRRKIIGELPNHYAFHIESVTGVGYAMENWIRLDILLDDYFQYSIFSLSKEDFESRYSD